jgi:hypothetical protein
MFAFVFLVVKFSSTNPTTVCSGGSDIAPISPRSPPAHPCVVRPARPAASFARISRFFAQIY